MRTEKPSVTPLRKNYMGPRYYVIAAWLSSFKRKDSIAAGTVVAVGKSVSDLREGDRVAWCSILSKEV